MGEKKLCTLDAEHPYKKFHSKAVKKLHKGAKKKVLAMPFCCCLQQLYVCTEASLNGRLCSFYKVCVYLVEREKKDQKRVRETKIFKS